MFIRNPLSMALHGAYVLRAPEPGGTGGSDTVDRGDDFVSTDDDGAVDDGGTAKETTEKKEAPAKKDEGGGDDDDVDPDNLDAGDDREGKGKDKKAPGGLPWSRHRELLAKERERADSIAAELAKYKEGDRVQVINTEIQQADAKIDELEAEYAKLITDGEHAKAAAKATEIRKLERETSAKKVQLATQAAEIRATERVRYDTTVERLEAAYPVINPDHADYDKDAAQDVMDLAGTYARRGTPSSEALQKAAKKLLGAETTKQETATETTARVDKDKVAEELRKERKAKAVDKATDAATRQPADKNKFGADSDKSGGGLNAKNIGQMKFDDFKKLDEETLSRMRGDTIGS